MEDQKADQNTRFSKYEIFYHLESVLLANDLHVQLFYITCSKWPQ